MNELLDGLNEAQYRAVTDINGPSLVIAGAGAGKTRVLTTRIAYLIQQGVKPYNILAMTFTNKAAKEMRERIQKMIGDAAKQLWMGTFHSTCLRILRTDGGRIGLDNNFSTYDTNASLNVVKQIIKDLKLDAEEYRGRKIYVPKDVRNTISNAKNGMLTPGTFGRSELYHNACAKNQTRIDEIFARYERALTESSALDFDDFLLKTHRMLRDNAEVLAKYQDKFKYIMVDEYQDTNDIQYHLIKMLAESHRNISVVGDDSQSIYAFRGAKIDNILNFKKDYPESETHKLVLNYRSTQTIVNAANSLIEKNERRIPKTVQSEQAVGSPIVVVETEQDYHEGLFVAQQIYKLTYKTKIYNETAILMRTNRQIRTIEQHLKQHQIPYRVYGTRSFYESAIIANIFAYGRLVVNHNDDEAFARIVNYPKRGIGDTTVQKLMEIANRERIPVWEVLLRMDELTSLNNGTKSKLSAFCRMIQELSGSSQEKNAYELVNDIIKKSGIFAELQSDMSDENRKYMELVDALLSEVEMFVSSAEENQTSKSFEEYLQNITLQNDDDTDDKDSNKVAVMTVHAAKGLEFDNVFVTGMEEMLFPSMRNSMNISAAEIEEERRLFYVALTRARKNVYLSYARMRHVNANLQSTRPSRFIGEIDAQYLSPYGKTELPQMNNSAQSIANKSRGLNKNYGYFAQENQYLRAYVEEEPGAALSGFGIKNRTPMSSSPAMPTNLNAFDGDDPKLIKQDMMVEHARFGVGQVEELIDEASNIKAKIRFQNGETKVLLLKFAKLKIVK